MSAEEAIANLAKGLEWMNLRWRVTVPISAPKGTKVNDTLTAPQMEALRVLADAGWVTASKMNRLARSTGDALVRRNLAERRLQGIGTFEWAQYRITPEGTAATS